MSFYLTFRNCRKQSSGKQIRTVVTQKRWFEGVRAIIENKRD